MTGLPHTSGKAGHPHVRPTARLRAPLGPRRRHLRPSGPAGTMNGVERLKRIYDGSNMSRRLMFGPSYIILNFISLILGIA